MSIKIYNTLTREKEILTPLTPGKVRMYVCGVTVYDSCHIGHARAAIVFDVIYRFLKNSGLDVMYVRNFTDIDDKIIKRTQELGVDYQSLTQKYIQEYQDEMKLLNVIEPAIQPRATQHIQEMIKVIQGLIKNGLAYAVGGDVYFEVAKFLPYGKLSRRTLDEMKVGARINPDEKKTHPEDFALWKGTKPGEPSWESPWGPGRPGWHIECSAMSMKHLGETFDIHGGGSDLIFPHHENEIAQSEGFSKHDFAKVWIHNEMIMIDQAKMSKSLGNVFVLKELLKRYFPRVIRYFILSKHYRTPMDFSFEAISESGQAFERIETTVARAEEKLGARPKMDVSSTQGKEWFLLFQEAMEDDFNTPKALGVLFKLLTQMNQDIDHESLDSLKNEFSVLLKMLDLLGLQVDTGKIHKIKEEILFEEEKVRALLQANRLTDQEIEYLVRSRESARRQKLWSFSDEIRNFLIAKGIVIQDEKDGVKVIRK